MNSRLFGGILLVIGTTIGAGILALPVATAQMGFLGATVLLISCWAIMMICAMVFLEVNLRLPPNSNLISMAGMTLGRGGQVFTWIVYLILLYSILSAYISGGGDLFHYLLTSQGLNVSLSTSAIIFTGIFGFIVYLGIQFVDYANRGLMIGKMGSLIVLIALIVPFVSSGNLAHGEFKYITSPTSLSITILAFTSLMIIPSLRSYFNDDIKQLRLAFFWGMFIPLICYIAWNMVILGVIPFYGTPGMQQIIQSPNSNSDIVAAITYLLQKDVITSLAKFFTSICMATSFLSIALCLSDFLADGFKVEKVGKAKSMIIGATLMPPLLVVLFYPDAFLRGLNYAGLCCFAIMIFLPALMAWRCRYSMVDVPGTVVHVKGGKFLLAVLMIFATLMMGLGLKGAI
ncbi:MAG: aromatic amino acid transport family protein [Gammaproteobacteria bacterium]